MLHSFFVFIAFLVYSVSVSAQMPHGYSGDVDWDEQTATLTFRASGAMPTSKEGFFYAVPPQVQRIVVAANTQFRGGFRILYRDKDNPLYIEGQDRHSSIIFGTDEESWTERNSVPENEKWKYSSISVIEDAVVHVSNITCQNPRGYIISGYANHAVIHVSRCSLIDTRSGNNNNSDGFAGAAGSSIKDAFISTADDGIKVYNDITIENTIIEHHRNGAPLQFGWGGETQTVNATIKGLVIKGVDPENRYNMAPMSWERGDGSVRNISIDGLEIEIKGEVYDEEMMSWIPIGLFELKPTTCEFNLSAINVNLHGTPIGRRISPGTVKITEGR